MQGFQLRRQALYQLNYIPSLSSSICLLTQVFNLSVVLGKLFMLMKYQVVESELGIGGLLLCTFRIIHQVTGGCLDLDN